jgi:nitrogen fixation NifU-like protein
MGDLYGAVITEHWRRPRNRGALEAPDVAHEGTNPLCGDRVRIELRLDGALIAEARFRGEACMVATASASLLTELVRGLSLAEAAQLPRERILDALQAPLRPSRLGCASLPVDTLREGIARYLRGGG